MNEALRIVVVSPELDAFAPDDAHAQTQIGRSRSLRIGLLEGGFNLVAVLPADPFLDERLEQLRPDLVIVDAESEARDALEHVVMATRDAPRPIVMFTNDQDAETARAAVAAGVSAYVVAGLAPERLRPILDVAMARFERDQAMQSELADAREEIHALNSAMKDRAVIDRAKALLMQRQSLDEATAYARLRKAAMDKNLRLVEVAQRMLDAAELLG
ncbi:ANTAR domain-containing protein [Curvibacter sp. APW13]|uniref:ANTAR domain-containing response regulator n=1 Tax=Curvibacter sp. APW13 TaxID=3077236 RepID=UPI0028DDFADD|nr:ANTAR domain-containing protein [Curvibacter sp. APW13]MDT8990772.1 ANTAR domain-containing protein [Curvibacter sp. APW13]